MNYLIEPQKQVEICARAEVLILGGGPSGIAAAIASARSGSKTIFDKIDGLNMNIGELILSPNWLRGTDLNRRPSGYEPDELPDCSTPRYA